MSETQIVKNQDEQRYEMTLDGELVGVVEYERDDMTVTLTHTHVEDEFAGQGYAAQLVDYALRDIVAEGLNIDPRCSYVQRHIEKNPEYASNVIAE